MGCPLFVERHALVVVFCSLDCISWSTTQLLVLGLPLPSPVIWAPSRPTPSAQRGLHLPGT